MSYRWPVYIRSSHRLSRRLLDRERGCDPQGFAPKERAANRLYIQCAGKWEEEVIFSSLRCYCATSKTYGVQEGKYWCCCFSSALQSSLDESGALLHSQHAALETERQIGHMVVQFLAQVLTIAGIVHQQNLFDQLSRRVPDDRVHTAQQRRPRFIMEHDDDRGGRQQFWDSFSFASGWFFGEKQKSKES